MPISKVYSGIVSRLDERLDKADNTLTMSNAFSGRTVASEGWLSVGDADDFQPGSDGSLPPFEEVYYTGYTKEPGTYTELTVFTGLTRADNTDSTETISDTWSGGTVVGASITGDLMSNLPDQDSPLGVQEPSTSSDAATKNYIDSQYSDIDGGDAFSTFTAEETIDGGEAGTNY